MATTLTCLVNYVDAAVAYASTPADYGTLDLTNDYLIWTAGNSVVKDLMTHAPIASELNGAATIIDDNDDTVVALCLWYDYSHNLGGAYYTHKVIGMGENKQYPFCFSFDGATATEPQLECWDDSNHTTFAKNVLGAGVALSSFVKGACTTLTVPGVSWAGAPLAGSTNVLLLNNGSGALAAPESGDTTELYANLKIVIPAAYALPAAETFLLTVRFTYI